jgi:hypothetical protein
MKGVMIRLLSFVLTFALIFLLSDTWKSLHHSAALIIASFAGCFLTSLFFKLNNPGNRPFLKKLS